MTFISTSQFQMSCWLSFHVATELHVSSPGSQLCLYKYSTKVHGTWKYHQLSTLYPLQISSVPLFLKLRYSFRGVGNSNCRSFSWNYTPQTTSVSATYPLQISSVPLFLKLRYSFRGVGNSNCHSFSWNFTPLIYPRICNLSTTNIICPSFSKT